MSSPVPVPALQEAARLLAEGRPMLAAERLGEMVSAAPTYAAAHVLRATALEAAGRVDEAIVSWGRAAALVPRSPLVHRERERLLATRTAESPADLPPAVPAPGARAPKPPPEPADVAPATDAPATLPEAAAPDLGLAPRTLDVSDLLTSPPMPRPEARPAPAPPPEPEPASEPELASEPEPASGPEPHGPRASAETPAVSPPASPDGWSPLAEAVILPPESRPPVTLASAPDDDPFGWDVLAERDVPTPPPGTSAEPDVIAPEDPPASDPPTVSDELDALIAQLEDAPRIRPDPEYAGPEQPLEVRGVDDHLVSETLAKIYAKQHQYVEAAVIYEKLAARRPDDADDFLRLAAELRRQG